MALSLDQADEARLVHVQAAFEPDLLEIGPAVGMRGWVGMGPVLPGCARTVYRPRPDTGYGPTRGPRDHVRFVPDPPPSAFCSADGASFEYDGRR